MSQLDICQIDWLPKEGTAEIDLRLFFFGKSRHGYGSWGRKSTAIQNILNLTSLKCLTHARHLSLSPPLDIQPLQEGDKERDRDDDQDFEWFRMSCALMPLFDDFDVLSESKHGTPWDLGIANFHQELKRQGSCPGCCVHVRLCERIQKNTKGICWNMLNQQINRQIHEYV